MGRKKKPQNGIVADFENVKKITVWGTSRVLTDKMEVDYYKAYIKEVMLLNKLIGSVSDAGNYNLKDRTKRDLVKMDKEIADYSPTYIVALSSFMGKVFNFAIEIDLLDDEMASASLYLNESVNYYPPVERLHSFIAKIVLPYDAAFYDKLCKAFNLYETTINVQDTDIPYLSVTMQEMADQILLFDEVSDLGSQIYVMRMLKTLSNGGEKGEEIIEEYKKQAEELDLDENKKGTYSILHRKLDEIIEEKGGLEKLPLPKEEAQKPRQEYNETIRKLDVAAAKKTAVMEKQREKEAKKQAKMEKTDKAEQNKSKATAGKTAGKKDSSSEKPKKPTKANAKAKPGGDKKKDKGKPDKKEKEESNTVKLGKTEFTPKANEETTIAIIYSDKSAPKAEVPVATRREQPKDNHDEQNLEERITDDDRDAMDEAVNNNVIDDLSLEEEPYDEDFNESNPEVYSNKNDIDFESDFT